MHELIQVRAIGTGKVPYRTLEGEVRGRFAGRAEDGTPIVETVPAIPYYIKQLGTGLELVEGDQ